MFFIAALREIEIRKYMAIIVFLPDGSSETIPRAVKVDYNYHEDSFDFCDENGVPMRQIRMANGITWEKTDDLLFEPENPKP